ncbi:MAG TPA: hypothetical protein PLA06_06825 [Syntrophorhabdaceae bacterium]|jgi:hypothetical protein|nr:hypothetical protein [Pseudomonadota bacterium]HQP51873.1 hypothetical protein [Syntrophorhabdaceae bacterium]
MATDRQKNNKDIMLPLRLGKGTHLILEEKARKTGLFKSVFIVLLIHAIPTEIATDAAREYREDTEAKDIYSPIRIDKETSGLLVEKAKACGMNRSAFIRFLIRNVQIKAVINKPAELHGSEDNV